MTRRKWSSPGRVLLWAAVLAGASLSPAFGQETNLYWGDTHLHTSWSSDAYSTGNVNADPDTAYRFAKGLPVLHPTLGYRVQLRRPLDFLAVSDHAVGFGTGAPVEIGGRGSPGLPGDPSLIRLPVGFGDPPPSPDEARGDGAGRGGGQLQYVGGRGPGRGGAPAPPAGRGGRGGGRGAGRGAAAGPDRLLEAAWPLYVDAADKHYEPGKFTTLVGWEWTSLSGGNLHRVVFTPAGGDLAKSFLPFSTRDSERPEDLWTWLDETSERLGIDFVAIPHNSNLSNGLMFDLVDSDGRPVTAELARQRIRWERVAEIAQIKGTSETHPALSPTDEFANFEIYQALIMGGYSVPNPGDYIRTALMRGLEMEADIGVNPYKIGVQGATDSHTGLSTAEENYFLGKLTVDTNPLAGPLRTIAAWNANGWDFSAQGITGVWATQNTREAITEAFQRKEVYATTGPRISVRVFGGFDFTPADAQARDIAAVGYAGGVPMGGDLTAAPEGSRVRLLIRAVKDPIGANLDRVQVVKGWLGADGESHERIYNVALSDGRTVAPDGSVPPVGNTVDLTTATYENSIGAPELVTVWEDPDFDRSQSAFYYLRVLEIPTPRHSTYDAVAIGVDPTAYDRDPAIQERAYSSPIWYTP